MSLISELSSPLALYTCMGSMLLGAAGVAGKKILDSAISKKLKTLDGCGNISSLVEEDPEEKADIQECSRLVAETLRSNRHLQHNCYIPPCGIVQKRREEAGTCLQLCMYQAISEEELEKGECLYLRTILQLFSMYLFLENGIPLKNRKDWEQLWNENAIIVNAAQKIVSGECGRYYIPAVACEEKNFIEKFKRYFGSNYSLDGIVSFAYSLNHGALLLDPYGKCEAFGAIVDGETVVKGNSARGARYNSGRNYVAWKEKIAETTGKKEKYAVLIVSDDGSKDVFTMEDFRCITTG